MLYQNLQTAQKKRKKEGGTEEIKTYWKKMSLVAQPSS